MATRARPLGSQLNNPGWDFSVVQGGPPPAAFPAPPADPSSIWPKVDFMLDQMITVESTIQATNSDFLAGTQLDQPGVPGVYTMWLASTVGDSTVTISLGGRTITDNSVIILRANSEIRENEDSYFQILSRGNGRPVISITEVTAMTTRVRVRFIPAVRT